MNNIIGCISIFCLFFGVVCFGFHDVATGVVLSIVGVVLFTLFCNE